MDKKWRKLSRLSPIRDFGDAYFQPCSPKLAPSPCQSEERHHPPELALEHLAAESADVLYHLAVLWAAAGITPEDVYAELQAREHQSGLAEKVARKS